jgi:pimeloyl-ACP methyl ester carboxylesterase
LTRLGEIRAPALIVVGTLDLPDIQGIAKRLAAEVRGARLEVIDGVGHMINLEIPDRFRALVTAFLSRR